MVYLAALTDGVPQLGCIAAVLLVVDDRYSRGWVNARDRELGRTVYDAIVASTVPGGAGEQPN